MRFYIAAPTLYVILELTVHGGKGVADGDVNVFMLVALIVVTAHDEFPVGHSR